MLPDDAYITTDVGWNKNGVGQQFPIRTPGTVLTPGGFATMGFGPSAAIGAKLAAPDRTVVSLVGDGGFGQNPAMLATAVEHDLGIVWVVMNNNAYGTIAGLQLAHFGLTYGTTFPGDGADPELLPNYAAVASCLWRHRHPRRVGRRLPSGAGEGDRHGPAGRPRRGDEEQPDAHDGALEHPRHLLAGRAALAPRHRLREWDVARDITAEEQALVADMVARARAAMARIADYDQARVDRLAQAIGWALGNETTFTRLAHMSVDESGIGDRDGRVAKRFKIHGILRDALAHAERRGHRARSRQGPGQVRQAGRGDRLDRADDEPRADPSGHGDLRDQGPRRGRSSLPTRGPSGRPARSSASSAR